MERQRQNTSVHMSFQGHFLPKTNQTATYKHQQDIAKKRLLVIGVAKVSRGNIMRSDRLHACANMMSI